VPRTNSFASAGQHATAEPAGLFSVGRSTVDRAVQRAGEPGAARNGRRTLRIGAGESTVTSTPIRSPARGGLVLPGLPGLPEAGFVSAPFRVARCCRDISRGCSSWADVSLRATPHPADTTAYRQPLIRCMKRPQFHRMHYCGQSEHGGRCRPSPQVRALASPELATGPALDSGPARMRKCC
jgi:hypothetical protein